jgi:hypothetical protein
MDLALVETVAKALKIRAVLLRSSSLVSNSDILPPSVSELELAVQFGSTPPTAVETMSLAEDGGATMNIALFKFATAVRLVEQQALKALRDDGKEISGNEVKLEIKAEFGVQYEIVDGVDLMKMESSLAAFCQHNVGFHVWPYWREFVHSTCARMGIPLVPVPMYQIKR